MNENRLKIPEVNEILTRRMRASAGITTKNKTS